MPNEVLNFVTNPGGANLIKSATNTRIFFVDSNGGGSTTSGGLAPESAFTTIVSALAACTSAKGDTIYVLPGHAESISGAIAWNKTGVSIVGLGSGTNRPLITWHTTGTVVTVAANVTVKNIQVTGDVDAVVSMFLISSAGITFDAVDFVDTAACAPLQFALTTAAGDDFTIQNCKHVQTASAAASVQAWIGIVGADRFIFRNNYMSLRGAASTAANGHIVGATTLSLDVLIDNNRLVQSASTSAVPISLLASSTGLVSNNLVASPKTAIAGSVAIASAYAMNNFACHVVNKSGLLDPVVDA